LHVIRALEVNEAGLLEARRLLAAALALACSVAFEEPRAEFVFA
jgi:hypothetical protein